MIQENFHFTPHLSALWQWQKQWFFLVYAFFYHCYFTVNICKTIMTCKHVTFNNFDLQLSIKELFP